ncbi:hypothetical protein LINGRAHAP2_LOCUS20266 [Linum grandiflorum]
MNNDPWCIMGDFNELLSASDKKGRVKHPTDLFSGFQEVVVDCGLIDMPLLGYQFTWARARGEPHRVEERLDRCFYTTSWGQIFSEAELHNLIAPLSDHTPILMTTVPVPMQQGQRRFRFKSQWTLLPSWKSVVTKSWVEGGSVPSLDVLTVVQLCYLSGVVDINPLQEGY